ncbi:MAG: hypothetical protein IJL48_07275 [Bacteroidales bacterium]|nr:hypothetical protein [Bacteroidales bacterium]
MELFEFFFQYMKYFLSIFEILCVFLHHKTNTKRIQIYNKKHKYGKKYTMEDNKTLNRATDIRMAAVLTSLASDLIFPHSDNDMESTCGDLNLEQERLRIAFVKVLSAKLALGKYIHEYQPGLDIRSLVSQVTAALAPLMKGGEK